MEKLQEEIYFKDMKIRELEKKLKAMNPDPLKPKTYVHPDDVKHPTEDFYDDETWKKMVEIQNGFASFI